jgi:hypothetical protein
MKIDEVCVPSAFSLQKAELQVILILGWFLWLLCVFNVWVTYNITYSLENAYINLFYMKKI